MQQVVATVVMPTRNRLLLMQRTLASVLRQDVDLEVLVVDEASSDGTAQWLEAIDDPRVLVIRHDDPSGVALARNAAIEQARGAWLAFIDDDDRWAPDKLASQLAVLRDTPDAQWSACGAVSVDLSGRIIRSDDAPATGDVASLLLASNRIAGGASGVVASTALVREVGGFDPSFAACADWDLWIRLALRSPVASVHRPLVAYLVHPMSMSTDVEGLAREARLLEEKHRTARVARGVAVDDRRNELWAARAHERVGRRAAAARIYVRWGWRTRKPRMLLDALRAVAAPRWTAHRRDLAKGQSVRASWRHEVERWLEHP